MASHVFFFGDGKADGDPKRRDLLGGKGAGLAEMTSLGLPVPPGFTISTEECSAFAKEGKLPADTERDVVACLARVEKSVGMTFGDPSNPLLLSVRSGSRASMPGMMDTILNLGLNDATAEGLAKKTQNARFAYDAYRRFIAMYSDVALGVKKEKFESALNDARLRRQDRRGSTRRGWTQRGWKRKVHPRRGPAGRRAERARDDVQRDRQEGDREGFPERSEGAARGGDRGGLQVVAEPPRRHLPPDARYPGLLGDRVQRASDGLRDPGRHERDRGRLHARSLDRRAAPLRRVAPERARRGRGRRDSNPDADPAEPGAGGEPVSSSTGCRRRSRKLVAILRSSSRTSRDMQDLEGSRSSN